MVSVRSTGGTGGTGSGIGVGIGVCFSTMKRIGVACSLEITKQKKRNHTATTKYPRVSYIIFLFSLVSIVCLILLFVYNFMFVSNITFQQQQQQQQQQHLQQSSTSSSSSSSSSQQQQQQQQQINRAPAKATIAFAVSVTGCGADPITEGAAVLKHSIHRSSIHGILNGKYDYVMYAIYHPDAVQCAEPLEQLGYILLKRDTPVLVNEIQGEYLRTKISSNGCCGEKELIKLEAYTLIQYPIVVHLDLDVLVLKPLDTLFDWMLDPTSINEQVKLNITATATNNNTDNNNNNKNYTNGTETEMNNLTTTRVFPSIINAFYTVDYNMVRPQTKYKPVQGGFLVLRPNISVYEEYKAIVRIGDYRENGGGWGGLVGPFYGSMTFQGIVPYYYNVLHPNESIELNRCIYNQMADNPRTGKTVNDIVQGDCRTGEVVCEDCRSRSIHDIVTTHYTLCQKPWWCVPHNMDIIQHRLCRKLIQQWYMIRSEMEFSWGRNRTGPGMYDENVFYGYCTTPTKTGYIPIGQPYHK